ncbi:uncharacterized protein BX663DRAFT_519736, partial [Cokeromyces recurvatus]|uniref:uncharacterized protein n=1 Tax=Cokeromyces recurvatus TaxID=90255 RepID=UPI00222128FD
TITKKNLNWKINYLAAQVGEGTHVQTALIAASRAKYQKMHNNARTDLEKEAEALKQDLYNARKLKLETKLHQALRELKSALKKAKVAEIPKQIRKIKTARESVENSKEEKEKDEESKAAEGDKKEKKPKKKLTKEDLEYYEKELEILKNVDLDVLAKKTLKSKLRKHETLKDEEAIKEVIDSSLKVEKTSDQLTQNVESRLVASKPVLVEVNELLKAFQNIIRGNIEKIEKRKADVLKKKEAEEAKKRKAEEEEVKKSDAKRTRTKLAGSSEFIESLGGGGGVYDEKDDEDFKKIYEGTKKPNRPGQRQRRKQWEEMYGREANHIASAYKKREEKRLANPDYKPKKKKSTPKPAPKPTLPHKKDNIPNEPVHPSWEAKRIQEEIMSKALSGQGLSNKKIVFDDND